MPYPVIVVTSHDPVSFCINLNNPKFDIDRKVEHFMRTKGLKPKIERPHVTIVSLSCTSTADQFEQIQQFVVEQNYNTVIIDSTNPNVAVMRIAFGEIVGFIKHQETPELKIDPAQVLRLNDVRPAPALPSSTGHTLRLPLAGTATATTSSSRLQLPAVE